VECFPRELAQVTEANLLQHLKSESSYYPQIKNAILRLAISYYSLVKLII